MNFRFLSIQILILKEKPLLDFKLTKLIIIKQIKIYIKWKCILKIRTLIQK